MDVGTKANTKVAVKVRSGGRDGRQPGPVGVAPAARLATVAPGGFGSPSAPTMRGCLKWLDATGRAGRNARARDSEKVRPSRGSYGPGNGNRHDGAPEGVVRLADGSADCATLSAVPAHRRRKAETEAPFGALSPSLVSAAGTTG
jgi:hypothetical protein